MNEPTSGMTALDFQGELKKAVAKILKDVQTKTTAGVMVSGVNVYEQQLPIIVSDDEDESQFFPYAIVRLSDGQTPNDDTPWIVNADILIGVHDDDRSGAGYKHVMVMCQRIIDEFAAEPLLSRMYRADQNMEWALQDDDTYPFYFGGVRLKFFIPKIGRREPDYV